MWFSPVFSFCFSPFRSELKHNFLPQTAWISQRKLGDNSIFLDSLLLKFIRPMKTRVRLSYETAPSSVPGNVCWRRHSLSNSLHSSYSVAHGLFIGRLIDANKREFWVSFLAFSFSRETWNSFWNPADFSLPQTGKEITVPTDEWIPTGVSYQQKK